MEEAQEKEGDPREVWSKPWVCELPDGSAQITLAYPVRTREVTVEKLEIRRLKGRDMKHLPPSDMLRGGIPLERVVSLLHVLSKEGKHIIDELDTVDILRASEVLAAFFVPGPGTGAT